MVYADPEGERRWGFFCTNCETFDNAVDAMGRIQCNQCANFHKAEEWDAAHEYSNRYVFDDTDFV